MTMNAGENEQSAQPIDAEGGAPQKASSMRRKFFKMTAGLLVAVVASAGFAGVASARPGAGIGESTTKDGCTLVSWAPKFVGGGWNTKMVVQSTVKCRSARDIYVNQSLKEAINNRGDRTINTFNSYQYRAPAGKTLLFETTYLCYPGSTGPMWLSNPSYNSTKFSSPSWWTSATTNSGNAANCVPYWSETTYRVTTY